ncbi:MAG: hypothetical protein IJW76_03470 [Clostridia bacterium]|nr:hypothetical protein [Clostridia bacterium]
MDIKIDFSKKLGEIKPVNGVCNGPSPRTAKYFKKAHIPFSRLHDMRTHFHDCCDIPSIFKDFDADENDPASYGFTLSDYYIEKIKECGTDIVYRLGSSMEQGDFRFNNKPPKDFAKWARICEHVIRHYNEGWANGHRYGIKYFEIWNEPDECFTIPEMNGQWTGTAEEFGEFLSVAASHLKKCFPDLYIGSYPSCNILTEQREAFFRTVFSILRENDVKLDFCSWHCYADDPERTKKYIAKVRSLLDEFGYTDTFQICTEWNYFWQRRGIWNDMDGENGEYLMEEMFTTASSHVGAAYSLAQMLTFQQSEVRVATLHRADALSVYCTMFNIYGVPQKQFTAFYAFDALRACGTEVKTDVLADGVYAAAASREGEYAVCVAQYRGSWKTYSLCVCGLCENEVYTAESYITDDKRNFELVRVQTGTPGEIDFSQYLKSGSIFVMKLKKAEKQAF